jgi:hypothetical protein
MLLLSQIKNKYLATKYYKYERTVKVISETRHAH